MFYGRIKLQEISKRRGTMKIYDIKDFGATGDGVTLNTAAIQKAIDTCTENGGGRVYISDGI